MQLPVDAFKDALLANIPNGKFCLAQIGSEIAWGMRVANDGNSPQLLALTGFRQGEVVPTSPTAYAITTCDGWEITPRVEMDNDREQSKTLGHGKSLKEQMPPALILGPNGPAIVSAASDQGGPFRVWEIGTGAPVLGFSPQFGWVNWSALLGKVGQPISDALPLFRVG